MAKSKRRRVQKVRRQAANAQRDRARRRRRRLEEAEQRASSLFDPETPIETVAELISEGYTGAPLPVGTARLLMTVRGSVDDVVGIARLLRDRVPKRPDLAALTFSAQAAYLAGDYPAARSATEEAFGQVDVEEAAWEYATYLRTLGRPSEAIDVLADDVSALIDDPDAVATYQYAIEDAYRRVTENAVDGECPCGSRQQWLECCRTRDVATVERFGDRDGLYSLRAALRDFVAGSDFAPAVDVHVREWLDLADTDSWEDTTQDALERLAIEHAWIVAGVTDDEDDDEDNPLAALATDPATDPRIAEYAQLWRANVRYGLWQVGDPSGRPGIHCVELCTGHSMYVAFAPEQIDQIPRWSVLVGAVVPIDGAWRATGSMISVTPIEADSLIEIVQRATEDLVRTMAGQPDPSVRDAPQPPGKGEPLSVYAYEDEPAHPVTAKFINTVVGSLLPRLLSDVRAARKTPPRLTNTDGDAMEMITATLAVSDPEHVLNGLAGHPDFTVVDDTSITWYGREVPEGQRQVMLAEARAQVGAALIADDPEEPQRWVRGQITVTGDQLRVEVNSRRRLDRIVAILDHVGGEPAVIDETRVDPAQDLPWTSGHRPARGGTAPPHEGWEKQWLSEPVPALGGQTPIEAADSEFSAHLEALLRQLEYDADVLASTGERGVDTGWLRDQLGMPS